jgi:FkbM family methyltransferase
MLARVRERIQALARKAGFEISRIPPRHLDRLRGQRLDRLDVDVVIDIGANEGQYAKRLREIGGYRGRIVSFEPGAAAFARLESACWADSRWECERLALMERDGEMTLRVAASDDLSSFRASSDLGRAVLPTVETHVDERVPTARLDSIYDGLVGSSKAFVKIDVQGAENSVLSGAKESLAKVLGLQIELPLVPLYKGQASAGELISQLENLGFWMVGVEPLWFDEALGLNVEFDALFLTEEALAELSAQAAKSRP